MIASYLLFLTLLQYVLFLEGSDYRCDYRHIRSAKGYFKLHVVPANWKEARLRCHLEGAVLASPINSDIKIAMLSVIASGPKLKSGVFLGVHATFSRGDFFSVEGVPLSKIEQKWADGEPDNYNDEESCLLMTSQGEFADVSCSETYPYICYKKSPVLATNVCGTTDPEYKLESRTGSCYKFHSVPRTWSRAFMTCAAEGGYLVIFNSETESQVVKEIFEQHPGGLMLGNFWKDVAFLGFHDWGEHGEWLTINGQTLAEAGYDKFSGGEPNNSTTGEYCGAMYRNGMFDDLWCENRYAFVCEKDPTSLLCKKNL